MKYIRTQESEGERSFRCYNCGKVLLVHLDGNYIIKLNCPRCKAIITIECREQLSGGVLTRYDDSDVGDFDSDNE